VFLVADDDLPAAQCSVSYHLDSAWTGAFQVSLKITNLSPNPITNGWALRFQFANGQDFQQLWNGTVSQNGVNVTVGNPSWNPVIPGNGGTVTDVGFIAHWDNTTNASPPNFSLNNARCARG
jgi:cellulase/cellobiase CelA1